MGTQSNGPSTLFIKPYEDPTILNNNAKGLLLALQTKILPHLSTVLQDTPEADSANFYIKIVEIEFLVFLPPTFDTPSLTLDSLHQTHFQVFVRSEDSWSMGSESVGGGGTEYRA